MEPEKTALQKAGLEQVVLVEQVRRFPLYELTEEQEKFCNENNIGRYLEKYRDLFFKSAEDIRKGKLTGTPLGDMLKIINEEGVVSSQWDIFELSQKYNINENEIQSAFAISGLAIIDGKPLYVPIQKGLMMLHETGLLDIIDKYWEKIATPELREEIRVRRQPDGPLYNHAVITLLRGRSRLFTLRNLYGILSLLESTSECKDAGLKEAIGTINAYIYARLFDEMPQQYKLVRHPRYISSEVLKPINTKFVKSVEVK